MKTEKEVREKVAKLRKQQKALDQHPDTDEVFTSTDAMLSALEWVLRSTKRKWKK